MGKLKVMTIVGTRPEIIRLSEVIKKCDECFNHFLVHTGQNWDYNLNEIFFEELKIRKPDYYLNCVGNSLGETMGNIIAKSYDYFVKEKPDAILVLGDTNSALSVISAKRLKIPIFHMEAGNRCFDQNVPEEINRKIIDHTSDVNLAYTEHARRYLLSEGFRKEYIFVTGSPLAEVLTKHLKKIDERDILKKLNLEEEKFILVSSHREENIDLEDNFVTLMSSINELAKKYNMPVIFSTHPRTWKKIKDEKFAFNPLVRNLKPFGFFDYCKLQRSAFCVVSDSGSLSEEASILDFPAVLIRTSTERPEALDKGRIVIGGIEANEIISSVDMAVRLYEEKERTLPADYVDTNISEKVVRIIQSYWKIINKTVWYKKDYLI